MVFGQGELEAHLRRAPPGSRADDVLDAFAGAWTARRLDFSGLPCGSAARPGLPGPAHGGGGLIRESIFSGVPTQDDVKVSAGHAGGGGGLGRSVGGEDRPEGLTVTLVSIPTGEERDPGLTRVRSRGSRQRGGRVQSSIVCQRTPERVTPRWKTADMPMNAPLIQNERDGLHAFLEHQREAVRNATYGLREDQARFQPTPLSVRLK